MVRNGQADVVIVMALGGKKNNRKPTGRCMDMALDIACYFRDANGMAHYIHFCDARKKLKKDMEFNYGKYRYDSKKKVIKK